MSAAHVAALERASPEQLTQAYIELFGVLKVDGVGLALLRLPELVIHTWDNNHADVTTLLTITPGRRGVVSSARANLYRGLFVHTYVPRTPPVALGVG